MALMAQDADAIWIWIDQKP